MSILFAFLVPWLTARLGDRFKPFATLIIDVGLVLVIILAAWGALAWHDHRVLSRYVERAKYDAKVAELIKARHERQVANAALDAYRKAAEADQLARDQQDAIARRQAEDHAKKCKAAGTCHPLSAEDWDYIEGGRQ